MPIPPDMARRYPADWALRRRFIIEYRARGRCEWCSAENGQPHPDTGSGVVLTLAHVFDKRPEVANLLNLAALCQRCHLNWDRREHNFNRIRNPDREADAPRTDPSLPFAFGLAGHGGLR